jgi:hypothetical protein
MAGFTTRPGRWREVGELAALLAERVLVGSRQAMGMFADQRRGNSIAYIGETLLRTLLVALKSLT